jgi:DNA repair protein RadD
MLRDYQQKLLSDIYAAWQQPNVRNVLAVAPTGAGKTKIKAALFGNYRQPGIAIAHRQELVGQISMALAEEGVTHRVIAPDNVIAFCIAKQVRKLKKSFVHPQSPIAVGGIDTLNARHDKLAQFINTVRLWDIDEAHHVLDANKWGRGAKLFTNAFGVGFTATPGRPDRRGLGRHASGVFDMMVMGPNMRPLIDRGYLADYRIFVPPASYVMDETDVSETTGDYKPERLRAKSHNSQITGDIVKHYLRIAPGKRGITFTVDVETANEVAAAFLHHGVPAAAINAKTPDDIRDKVIGKFEAGEIKQLVNVDIFGEGFDVPAVEVVSDGRSTKSFPRYAQAFGRALRPAAGKTHGIYIDHVSNVKVHGLPDKPRLWTLDDERGKRRQSDESASVRVCEACFNAYEPFRTSCPYCGHKPVPSNRGAPEFVDGDLIELDPFVLAQMRGEIERIDSNGPSVPRHLLGTPAELRLRRLWGERQSAQETLRQVIDYWAGIERVIHDLSDSELYRKFYHSFGVDVYTAQTFDRYNTEKLITQIRESWI